MNPELRLVLNPTATYAALAASPMRIGPVTMLRRPVLVAIVVGFSVAIAGTRHVAPMLVVSTTISWSVLVIAQMMIAFVVFAAPAMRTVGIPRAIDLFFASHVPWSLWILAVAAWAPVPGVRAFTPVLVTALAPMVLTPRMIAAFCREVLGMERRKAIIRTTMHQVVTWGVFVAVYGWSVALWPRIVQWLQ